MSPAAGPARRSHLLPNIEETEEWMARAECRKHPGVDFFPDRGASHAIQQAICAVCPVKTDCLEYALSMPQELTIGVWGGTSHAERKRMRRRKGRRDADA